MSGITNDPTGTNQVKSKAVIQILSFLAQMCSITRHCTLAAVRYGTLATACALLRSVPLLACCYVYLFSYLLIISSVACVSVTMKQCVSVSMCTCYPALKSAYLRSFVSFGLSLRSSSSLLAWCTRFLAGKKKPHQATRFFS